MHISLLHVSVNYQSNGTKQGYPIYRHRRKNRTNLRDEPWSKSFLPKSKGVSFFQSMKRCKTVNARWLAINMTKISICR